jgi:hypothetical protein
MNTIYKEYVLTGKSVWHSLRELVRANAVAMNERGTPLRIIVTSSDRKRSSEQNAFYWSAVLRDIADQAWVIGQQFTADVWHEHYARMFGVCEDVTLPTGEVIVRRKSTTDMKVSEFSEYLSQVQADAAQNHGVRFTTLRSA